MQHSSDINSPCKRPFLQTALRHTAYVARQVRSSSCTQSGSLRTLLLSGAQREALYLQGGNVKVHHESDDTNIGSVRDEEYNRTAEEKK